jgi:predicted NUDIX family phosphoesterase
MAPDLQERAQSIAERFQSTARRPVVLEFAGTPKAGKTTTISQLQTFLKRCGFRVKVVVERASICPIRDKKHFNFNVWTACTTLAQILEHTQEPPSVEDPQILILDRGLFDSICWLTLMDRLSRIRTEDRKAIEKFLLLDDWRRRITGVVLMTASPEDALEREQGFLPMEMTGSIMNTEVLAQTLVTVKECSERMKNQFRIFHVDTSGGLNKGGPKKTVETVADIVLNLIDEQLAESILHVERLAISKLFGKKPTLVGGEAVPVLEEFHGNGKFESREDVEKNPAFVQALPIVVVRNRSGEILRLRRKEKSEQSSLHQKLVIWAGGHVRQEDASNGDAIKLAAQRELQEELRLSVEIEELRFLGAIYADAGDKLSRHVALVFEWRAETDDVAVTLSTAEFFERRGTSLSGKFVALEELSKDVETGDMPEPWSMEIVNRLLPTAAKPSGLLF